jgi:hypothetical protein
MQGPEYWRDAGFVGCFADDVQGADRNDGEVNGGDDDDNAEEDGTGGREDDPNAEEEWDDDAPVLEIYEPLDGGESRVITHESQKAFEQSPGFPY